MITLENKFLKVMIDEKGAQWTSLVDKLTDEELLWQPNPQSWNRQAPLLFPIVGKLKEDQYIYHGQIYSMTQHGFLRDIELRVVSQSESEVIFEANSTDETKAKYPFDFVVRITMMLKKNCLSTKVVVHNPSSSSDLYFNFGAHPGFKVDHDYENEVFFESKKKKQGRFLLDGPFVNGYESFKQKEMKLSEIKLPETLILDEMKSVTLRKEHHDISVSMKPAHYMALWAPTHKESGQLDGCLCIEPWWGIGDCVDHNHQLTDKKGIIKLSPMKSQEFEYKVKIEKIEPPLKAPTAIGPYSIVREYENTLYLSGQLPLDPKSNDMIWDTTIEAQTRQVLTNVKAVLQQQGLEMSDILKTTVYLSHMAYFTGMNHVYEEFFSEPYPSRTTVGVAALPKNAMVEIEVIAKRK